MKIEEMTAGQYVMDGPKGPGLVTAVYKNGVYVAWVGSKETVRYDRAHVQFLTLTDAPKKKERIIRVTEKQIVEALFDALGDKYPAMLVTNVDLVVGPAPDYKVSAKAKVVE